jgi:hypothetical protein
MLDSLSREIFYKYPTIEYIRSRLGLASFEIKNILDDCIAGSCQKWWEP